MMILNAYSVYDIQSQSHMTPYFMQFDGQAVRFFGNLVNQEGHAFNRNPEDYTLKRIGTFNDENATLETDAMPELIATGNGCIDRKNLPPELTKMTREQG